MGLRHNIAGLFKGFAAKIIDVDDTARPEEQLELLADFLKKYDFELHSKETAQIVPILKKKHLVDSILVTNRDGSVVVSSEGNGMREAILGTSLFNYIKSELPKSEGVLIKNKDDWFMLMPHNNLVYIIKSSSDLSTIELKALARELEKYLDSDTSSASVKESSKQPQKAF
ncbi:MAG: hypothetical protein V1672_05280 [Candidatus Diapherotrites archaeon]